MGRHLLLFPPHQCAVESLWERRLPQILGESSTRAAAKTRGLHTPGEKTRGGRGGVPATVRCGVAVLGLQGTGLSKTQGHCPAYSDGAGLWLEQRAMSRLGTRERDLQCSAQGVELRQGPQWSAGCLRGGPSAVLMEARRGSKEGSEPLPLRSSGGWAEGVEPWLWREGAGGGMGEGG